MYDSNSDVVYSCNDVYFYISIFSNGRADSWSTVSSRFKLFLLIILSFFCSFQGFPKKGMFVQNISSIFNFPVFIFGTQSYQRS